MLLKKKNDSISFRLFLLIAVVNIEAGKKSSINNSAILLTSSLASQCGLSVKIDQLGNAMIFASLQNCFAQNVDDKAFTTTLNLRLHGNQVAEDELYQMAETCHYTAWASREIVCERNYMEVSVKRSAPGDYTLPKQPFSSENQLDAGFRIKTLVFFTPEEEKTMKVTDAQGQGYGISNTPTRLVLRSPITSPETYTWHVAGVPMTVLKTSTIFEKKWLSTQIHAAAACGHLLTRLCIRWFLPRHIDPLILSGQFKLLEVHMGVDGQRLDAAEMTDRRYSLSVNDIYIIIEIPVGAVGGHFKSHVQNGQYLTTYTIEPMLELLWTEDAAYEDTRYKVLLPITSPLLSRPPQVIDNTVPEDQIFKMLVGPFCSDVALKNITFPSEVLSIADCNARGLKVLEHMSPESCSKVFTLEVPFTYHGVVQRVTNLYLSLFFYPSAVPPSVTGGCDYQNFYILVKYGTHGFNFQTQVGKQMLTSGLARKYSFMDNGTHFSFTVPFSAHNAAIEAIEASSVRSRLDVTLRNPDTTKNIQEFSVACSFMSTLTECFPNGTITALAMKLESVPSLQLSHLTLRDPTCGPTYSDDHYAHFTFTGNSCGTTRKFLPNMMVYENGISLPDLEIKKESKTDEPEYELKVACYFDINTNHAVAFNNRPRRSKPYAENAMGELQFEMRLALDDSYSTFHRVAADPIAKYLQEPLYIEVELMKSKNPEVSLELVSCWATEDDRTSLPKWDLIINGCANPKDPNQVIFHPVLPDARVQYPSNFKRFEIPMFAFAKDKDNLSQQVFVHCDVVVCDARSVVDGECHVQCSNKDDQMKGRKRAVSEGNNIKHVSSGPILMR
uniref:ZP domain-containing protein n=1 Tax=Cyclopterus lumpus TaxID=8103 RepID=A0A8C2ZPV2_CYCLU